MSDGGSRDVKNVFANLAGNMCNSTHSTDTLNSIIIYCDEISGSFSHKFHGRFPENARRRFCE